MTTASEGRRAGVLLPLFSCPSSDSWGIGDIGDLEPVMRWLASAGQRLVQLLPLNEMASGQQSPYSAISAMALDPLFIRVPSVPDFAALGGEEALGAVDRAAIEEARRSPRIEYAIVRGLKRRALEAAFERFHEAEWRPATARAEALVAFVSAQRWWLDDYALFRALHEREAQRPWLEWPAALQQRDPETLGRARAELGREILFYQYLQWQADVQWQAARRAARRHGVQLFGDLPFMVDGNSADVWAHQSIFILDASLGVPPDAFSATGQDWGMPVYNWPAIRKDGFQWLRERARRMADLHDGYRVDHLVGFYRTYGRPRDGSASFFTPSVEEQQREQGETVLGVFLDHGAAIIAEDLGVVPDFVRESLARLSIAGYRVFRWERHWHVDGQPFRNPLDYPACSVATSGTHDTEPLAVWWDDAPAVERRQVGAIPIVAQLTGGVDLGEASFDNRLRDALLEALNASGSDLLLLPIQDLFGWRERINEPATVNDRNWTFRLPWPCDRLTGHPVAVERAAALRAWAERHGRR